MCKKAGVPTSDVRGRITSHRARSTIASQLFNAKEPMGLFELQQFLGHASPASTQRYIQITPTKLAKSYSDAGYFARNIRAVEVLIDQDAVRSGSAATEPWKFYDLGHGYCTYDFFDQCPYRMACAKCDFYLPKDSSRAQLIEAKANLFRMRQDIPLNDDELAAIQDGLTAYEHLLEKLVDVPTPAGPTLRHMSHGDLVQLTTQNRGNSKPPDGNTTGAILQCLISRLRRIANDDCLVPFKRRPFRTEQDHSILRGPRSLQIQRAATLAPSTNRCTKGWHQGLVWSP